MARCSGGALLLSKRRQTSTSHRGAGGRLPRGVGVLPDQRRDDPPVQGEGGVSDGEEEGSADQAVAAKCLAVLRGTGEFKVSQGIALIYRVGLKSGDTLLMCEFPVLSDALCLQFSFTHE